MHSPPPPLSPTAVSGCSALSLALLQTTRQQLAERLEQDGQFWLYAYGSLLWRPQFEPAEIRPARLWGQHRALRMRSRVNRGSADCPGLVFALLPGGSCVGQVHRARPDEALAQLDALWEREMPNGVYTPRWLRCHTPGGPVEALAFTLDPAHPSHTGRLDDAAHLAIFRNAEGRYGRTVEYLDRTAQCLQALSIRDAEVSRLVGLARRHGLLPGEDGA
jgi:glutathione-specific gamma-glutamylcyclotransferase